MRQFGSSSRVLNRVLSKGAAQQFATTEQKISRITASQPQRSLLSILICGTLLSGCVGSTVSTTLETAALNSPESEETTFSPESVDPNTQLTKIPVPVRSPVSSELALAPASQTTTVAEATSEVIAEQSTQTPAQTVAAAKPTPSPAATLTKQTKPAEEQLASAAKPKTKTAEKPTGFFAALFGANKQKKTAAQTAKLQPKKQVRRPVAATNNALPGVKRSSALFGINEDERNDEPVLKRPNDVQVASVGGFTRQVRNGLVLQTERVQVDCFKPELMRILKVVERRYKKRVMVTSGYRSPKGNRRAGGVSKSTHIYCKAADIQVEGVSKWDLAKYLRTLPNRGGVGTYCRTKSVHIDVGTQRDWHHPCRRGKKRRS